MRIKFKNLSRKFHAYISLIFFLPILIACLSGAILVYKDEINSILIPQIINSIKTKDNKTSLDEIRDIVSTAYPDYEIVGLNIDKDPAKSYKVWLLKKYEKEKEWVCVYFDVFSKKILSQPLAHDSGFLGFLTELHENLLLEKVGQGVLGFCAVAMLLISITGFVIYGNFWANLFRLRFKRVAVFVSDFHKMIGILCTPVLFAVAITGAWWEFRFAFSDSSAYDEFIITDKIYNKNISLDGLVKRAGEHIDGFSTHYISLPFSKGAGITLYGYVPEQSFLFSEYASTVGFSAQNGDFMWAKDITKASFKEQFFGSFRKAHFGNYNDFTKLVWAICGILPLFLIVSGFYLWFKRLNLKKGKNCKKLNSL